MYPNIVDHSEVVALLGTHLAYDIASHQLSSRVHIPLASVFFTPSNSALQILPLLLSILLYLTCFVPPSKFPPFPVSPSISNPDQPDAWDVGFQRGRWHEDFWLAKEKGWDCHLLRGEGCLSKSGFGEGVISLVRDLLSLSHLSGASLTAGYSRLELGRSGQEIQMWESSAYRK